MSTLTIVGSARQAVRRSGQWVKMLTAFCCCMASLAPMGAQPAAVWNRPVVNASGTRTILLDDTPSPLSGSKKLDFVVDALSYFKNNEFVAEKSYGYTLPGFRFTAKARFTPLGSTSLEVGFNTLYFWGADHYPSGIYAPPAASHSEDTRPLLLTPWLRIRWDMGSATHIVLGNLYNNRNHDLPLALYNDEWCYATRPEAGMQLLHDGPRLRSDVWVNWQQYMFFNDTLQEQFIAGASLRGKLLDQEEGWQVGLPFHFLVKHYGGEFTLPDFSVLSVYNMAVGLAVRRNFAGDLSHVAAESYLMRYSQTNDSLTPFDSGWGVQTTLAANYRNFHLALTHWVSEGFSPIMGSPHFGNVSTNYPGLTMDGLHVFVAKANYAQYRLPWAMLNIEGAWIHYFPWTGDRPGYGTVERGSSDSFSFGLSLRFLAETARGGATSNSAEPVL